jgi:oligopeptide/dipeptide ABC transporter ATP-binding protein
MAETILSVEGLKKHYPVKKTGSFFHSEWLKAVDGVDFSIKRGETLGLVGESGCGKSTIRKLVLRLEPATSGEVTYQGKKVFSLPKKELAEFRKKSQVIFQDPYSSLDPKWKVGSIIGEALHIHRIGSKRERKGRVLKLMDLVGLQANWYDRHPHEFSGGQRQRIGIARALALDPELIVADEPVSALDVSIQAQVLNLLIDLQQRLDLTYLFISHDLSVIRYISSRVAVMYLGKLVEVADTDDLFSSPLHPYTKLLMEAIPLPDPELKAGFSIVRGEVPSPINPPSACRFHPRCREVKEICRKEEPKMVNVRGSHYVACHLHGK